MKRTPPQETRHRSRGCTSTLQPGQHQMQALRMLPHAKALRMLTLSEAVYTQMLADWPVSQYIPSSLGQGFRGTSLAW